MSQRKEKIIKMLFSYLPLLVSCVCVCVSKRCPKAKTKKKNSYMLKAKRIMTYISAFFVIFCCCYVFFGDVFLVISAFFNFLASTRVLFFCLEFLKTNWMDGWEWWVRILRVLIGNYFFLVFFFMIFVADKLSDVGMWRFLIEKFYID